MLEHWLSTHTSIGQHVDPLDMSLTALDAGVVRRLLGADDDGCEVPLVGQPPASARIVVDVAASSSADELLSLRWRPADDTQQFSHFVGVVALLRRDGMWCDLGIMGSYRLDDRLAQPRRVMTSTSMLARRLTRGLARELRTALATRPRGDSPRRPLQVRDVMSTDPLVLRADADPQTAALLLLHHRYSAAPVVDGDGRLIGVISETDLFELATRAHTRPSGRAADAGLVGDMMSRPAVTTRPETTLRDAAAVLDERDIGRLVVVDDGAVVGVVARRDLLKALADRAEVVQHALDEQLSEHGPDGVAARVQPDGAVVLHGAVRTPADVDAAIAVAHAVEGVTAVTALVDVVTTGGGARAAPPTAPHTGEVH